MNKYQDMPRRGAGKWVKVFSGLLGVVMTSGSFTVGGCASTVKAQNPQTDIVTSTDEVADADAFRRAEQAIEKVIDNYSFEIIAPLIVKGQSVIDGAVVHPDSIHTREISVTVDHPALPLSVVFMDVFVSNNQVAGDLSVQAFESGAKKVTFRPFTPFQPGETISWVVIGHLPVRQTDGPEPKGVATGGASKTPTPGGAYD